MRWLPDTSVDEGVLADAMPDAFALCARTKDARKRINAFGGRGMYDAGRAEDFFCALEFPFAVGAFDSKLMIGFASRPGGETGN